MMLKSFFLVLIFAIHFSAMAEEAIVDAKPSEMAKAVAAEKSVTSSESEIALNLEPAKNTKNSDSPLFKMLMTISILGLGATGAIFYFKKNGYKNTKLKQNQIKVLTQYYLGPKKSLAIVRVAGESILIGVTENNINHIKTLSLLDEDIPESTQSQFQDLMASQTEDRFQMSSSPAATTVSTKTSPIKDDFAEEEEFSMRGLKDIVSKKMKNMRTIQ